MALEPFKHHFRFLCFFELQTRKSVFWIKKIKIFPKKRHQSIVNLTKKVRKKTAISLQWIWFCVKKTLDWWRFSKKNIVPKFSSVFWWVHQIYTSKSDFWISKTKNAHNSLNNGVRAVLTAFLDFQFFKAPFSLW